MAVIIFDSKEEIPEHLQASAKEVEGKWHVDPKGLLDKNSQLLGEVKRFKAEAAKLAQYEGLDPEQARAALAEIAKAAEEKAKAEGNWEALKKQLMDAHQAELKKLADKVAAAEQETTAFKGRYANRRVENDALAAISEAKGVPTLLLPHVMKRLKFFEDEDSVKVVGPDGQLQIDGKGNPKTIKQAVEEMKTDPIFAPAFEGSGHSGSGSRQNQGQGGAKTFTITREQAKDHALYQRIRGEAAKAGAEVEVVG